MGNIYWKEQWEIKYYVEEQVIKDVHANSTHEKFNFRN